MKHSPPCPSLTERRETHNRPVLFPSLWKVRGSRGEFWAWAGKCSLSWQLQSLFSLSIVPSAFVPLCLLFPSPPPGDLGGFLFFPYPLCLVPFLLCLFASLLLFPDKCYPPLGIDLTGTYDQRVASQLRCSVGALYGKPHRGY